MYSYELMQMQVAERRAQFEQEAARIRFSKRSRKASRTWFRRSATATTTAVAPAPIGEPVVFSGAIPPLGTAEFNEWAAALGRQLAQHGIPSVDAQLRALARRAREQHVGGVVRRARGSPGAGGRPSPGVLTGRHGARRPHARSPGRARRYRLIIGARRVWRCAGPLPLAAMANGAAHRRHGCQF